MDTKTLIKLCVNNNITKPYFNGVYAANQIPIYGLKYPGFIIVNTKPDTHSGEHWVVFFYISENYIEFFDSLGFTPYAFPDFITFFEKNKITVDYNTKQLQNFKSDGCALHCLYFCYFKCKLKYSLDSFLHYYYTSDTIFNDCYVLSKIKKHFEISPGFLQTPQIIKICENQCDVK